MSGSAEADFAARFVSGAFVIDLRSTPAPPIRLSGWRRRPGRKRGIRTIGEEKYLFLKGPKIIEPVSLPGPSRDTGGGAPGCLEAPRVCETMAGCEL
jgi:hypothetical protein